ncbi:uncharacterized protein LOC143179617 [Calliopsis andreniformis]|uniref:uncharacterized protein LOC143179617 n=1 Tax=Calliopsis andreniformis TaxID=337506 RepID=UPI003FCD07BF
MFYSYELLSFRRKGNLARCWLAATVSEKMFKQAFKSKAIDNINVSITCEEILNAIEVRNGKSHGRFSLYLSSQLMYGATKIFFYQTKMLQDYVYNLHCTWYKIDSRKNDFYLKVDLQIPEVPLTNELETLRHAEQSSLHLIREEESYIGAVEKMMQDEMNFGVLSSLEMEKFLLLGPEESSLNDIRQFRWDQSEEVPEESVQIPLVDVNNFEVESIEMGRETRVASARRTPAESLIVAEDEQSRRSVIPTTPKKRTLKSPTETPTKKSKKNSEGVSATLLPLLPPPEAPLPEVHQQELVAVNALESELELPLLVDEEEVVQMRGQSRGRRRRLFDDRTKLTDNVMRKWLSDVRAHALQQFTLPSLKLPSADEYLTQPLVNVFGKTWGRTLTKHFQRYLVKPVMVQDESFEMPDFEIRQTIPGETIRQDTVHDQTDEVSKLPITAVEMTTDQLKTTITEGTLVEIPIIEREPMETLEISDKHDLNERKFQSLSKFSSPSSASTKTHLSKKDLLALLEIHWHDGSLVKFHELISPENDSKMDAAYGFQYCLEFHKEKIVVLKQAEPFDTIWIEKFHTYSSDDDRE